MRTFGLLGLILVQGSLLPQLVALVRARRSGVRLVGVSRLFYVILFIGLACYLIYSVSIREPIYIASNIVGLVQTGASLWMVRK